MSRFWYQFMFLYPFNINIHIHYSIGAGIIHPYENLNAGLAKPLLKLVHG